MKILYFRKFLNNTAILKYSTKANNKYSSTVLLPQTKFPLRLEGQKLVERDKAFTSVNEKVYFWQQENLTGPEFILHDGPPYANGIPHMGHAINKILKDTILRTRIVKGQKVNYIPGWDCHGLPIELKAVTKSKKELSALDIRRIARNFASETIEKQKAAFKSWAVIGDWDHPYKTFNKNYICNQIRQFYNLYSKKMVYRDIKPVYWSPSSRTALAEAELEYNPAHQSKAATVRFKVIKSCSELSEYKNLYICIWTTTPWSLPSNQIVCYNKDLQYSLIKEEGKDEVYVIATELIQAHSKLLKKEFNVLKNFSGSDLSSLKYEHPIYKKELPLVHSEHATASKGTGLVHAAPAHGPEDFLVALNENIKIISMVDECGKFTSEAGPELEGLDVLEKGTEKVLNILKENLLHLDNFTHSYPYDWRTKKPVILRASKQWFLDTNSLKIRAKELLDDVAFVPKANSEIYKKNLLGQITKRPYWCISRQRIWGVPIPVFYHKTTQEVILNSKIVEHLCGLIDKDLDFWWKLPLTEIFPETLCKELNIKLEDLEQGQDIFDIWFDSGLSWSSVLKDDQIADMYLEGVDQCTGWFQSSLLTSIALRDKLPYKSIYVHGFAVDESGLKMSKSLGNVINPDDIIKGTKKDKPYGVDVLRWWVACHANQESLANVSKNILQASSDEVQKIRAILRFAISAIYNFKVDGNKSYDNLKVIDKYMLHLLQNYHEKAMQHLENYEYNKICQNILHLITNRISSLYYVAIKDRLYCEDANSIERKSAQFVLYQIFNVLTKSISPIVPNLAEELYQHLPQKEEGSYFQNVERNLFIEWENSKIENLMDEILKIRADLNKLMQNALDQDITIMVSRELQNLIEDEEAFSKELSDILQVASVNLINTNEPNGYKLETKRSSKHNCNRCRRYTSICENDICNRCKMIIESIQEEKAILN